MKAVVLVGGEGTRLRPLTLATPKPLLPIAHRPFLERQLAWLASHGVDDVVLAMGYLPDAFRAHFADDCFHDDRFGDVRLTYAVEDEPLGTAGAIRFAAATAGIGERFVVCNGDVLTALDLAALVRFHDARRAQATIHLVRVADPSAFGVVPTHDDGEVKAFVEKPPPGQAPTDWVNAGTYVLEPTVLDRIPTGLNVSIERDTFPWMLDARGALYALASDVYWLDIGTPAKYRQAHTDVIGGALGLPPVARAEERAPGVWADPGARIDPSAQLVAPVLIGAGSTIGAGADVVSASIGRGCSVGDGAQVEGSVLLDEAEVGANAQVHEAILGPGALVSAGASVRDAIEV